MFFTVEINGIKVTAKRDETILALLNRNGIKVPTLCHMNGFTPTGACRMCVVEVEGVPGLVTSCSHPVEEWMKIHTHSPKVLKARRSIVELLLANHPDECHYCNRTGTCELTQLTEELNINERKYRPKRKSIQIDRSCNSIERDPAKCVLCGRCIRICDEVIGVSAIEVVGRGSKSAIGTAQNYGFNEKACVKCGQCILVCPTNAIKEKMHYSKVIDALNTKDLTCVVSFSPTLPVYIAEEYGLKSGKDIPNLLKTALKRVGFKAAYDLSFSADLTTLETANELRNRLERKEKLPLFTSCCPSWVRYAHTFRPELTPHLSPVKSPQSIMGSLIKSYIGPQWSIPSENIFSVAVMPCTAKKHEAKTEAHSQVDAVITARELMKIFRLYGIDMTSLEPEQNGSPFNIQSSSGRMFGVAGGTLEALIRTFYYQMTEQELTPHKIIELRGLKGRKEFKLKIGKATYGFAAVSGLANAKLLLDEIKAGRDDLHMVEVMVCPNGCINGGGQRNATDEKTLKSRIKALYDSDEEDMIRVAHKNPQISQLLDNLKALPDGGNVNVLLRNETT